MRDIRRIINSLKLGTQGEVVELNYPLTRHQRMFLDALVRESIIQNYSMVTSHKTIVFLNRATGFPIHNLAYCKKIVSAQHLARLTNVWGIISTRDGFDTISEVLEYNAQRGPTEPFHGGLLIATLHLGNAKY